MKMKKDTERSRIMCGRVSYILIVSVGGKYVSAINEHHD
jgi:hypothetical protein